MYLASDLLVYYRGEECFAPDLLAVVDVEPHEREKWVVQEEQRGLDWVLEVHVHGDSQKDAKLNVQRYARLGIREYFSYNRAREELVGYRLVSSGRRRYRRLKARRGRYKSLVLGLEMEVKDGKTQNSRPSSNDFGDPRTRIANQRTTSLSERRTTMDGFELTFGMAIWGTS